MGTPISETTVARFATGDPQVLQKPRKNPGEDSKYFTRLSPWSQRKSSAFTRTRLRKAAPCCLRHRLQWQFKGRINGPASSNLTPPHRQLPLVAPNFSLLCLTAYLSESRQERQPVDRLMSGSSRQERCGPAAGYRYAPRQTAHRAPGAGWNKCGVGPCAGGHEMAPWDRGKGSLCEPSR